MTFWLVPIQEDMWDNIQYDGVYGYKTNLSKYIKKGDNIIFYVSKYYATRYGGKIVGIGRVISDWYYDETPLYPEEKVRNRAVFPQRVKEPNRKGQVRGGCGPATQVPQERTGQSGETNSRLGCESNGGMP